MSTPVNRPAATRGRDPTSFVLRRILPIMSATMLAAGAVRWYVAGQELIPQLLATALMVAFAVAVGAGYSLWAARSFRESTAGQRGADRDALYRLVATIPGGAVFVFDRDLRYVIAEGMNFAEAGLAREELEGRTIWEALEPEVAAAIEPSYRAALAGQSQTFELAFRENVYRVAVAPTYDDDGEIVGGIVQSQQVTEQRQLEEQLHQSQRLEAVGALAGGVAHDFNNLLTVITGYASIYLTSAPVDDPQRIGIEQVALAADRAAVLTQQLLAFSRKQVLHPQVLDVSAVVEGVEAMLGALVEERIELVVELEAALPRVLFDRGRLEQVIVNLVVNARDAIEDNGRIVVEAAVREVDADDIGLAGVRPGRHVMLAVSDTGTGMDEATQARIFEPFFTTKPVGAGTGLGLSTVHGIVKQSNGIIGVDSEPGQGTTFRVYLPLASAADLAVELSENPPASEATGEVRGTVLLVEDHAAVRLLTERLLGDAGYIVLATGSYSEAAAVLAESSVDLVLTDLVMPGGSGEQIAGCEDARGIEPRILYMSGYTEAALSRDDLGAGAGFLEKPFTPTALLAAVAAAGRFVRAA